MLTLGTGDIIAGVAGTVTALTCSIFGMELNSNVETYKLLDQRQLPSSVATLYSTPGSTTTFVKSIHLANTTGSVVGNVKLYIKGNTAGNQLIGLLSIPANGWAVYGEDGWRVYNSDGELLQKIGNLTTGGAASPSSITRQTMVYSSTTTDADPGAGIFRFDSGTIGSITKMYFDLADQSANDLTAFLDAVQLSDSRLSTIVRIYDASAPPKFISLRVTGRTTATGYRKFDVQVINGPATFNLANAASYTVQWQIEDADETFGAIRNVNGLGYRFGMPGFVPLMSQYEVWGLNANTCFVRMFRISRPIYVSKVHWLLKQAATTKSNRWLMYRVKHVPSDQGGQPVFGANIFNSGIRTTDFIGTLTARSLAIDLLLEPGMYAMCCASGAAHTGSFPIASGFQGTFGDSMMAPASNNANLRVGIETYISADKCTTLENPLTGTVVTDYASLTTTVQIGYILGYQLEYWEL